MTELPRRELGRTGLQVTMLGYGAMELRGAPRGRDVTETQAETILHAVLDAGINYSNRSAYENRGHAAACDFWSPSGSRDGAGSPHSAASCAAVR
jgi:predicted aldo/keto reductase-like oxidoreductase